MNDVIVGPVVGRRQFLGGLTLLVGGAALMGPGRGLLNLVPWVNGAQPFTRTAVVGRVGEALRIVGGAHDGVRLMIASIAELPNMTATVPDDQFAARFIAPSGVELASGMYWFTTRSFGKLPLYVSPLVDAAGRTTGYEALVNRYVPAAFAARQATSGVC